MIFVSADGNRHAFKADAHAKAIGALANDLRRRQPAGAPVGLLFRSGPTLTIAWLASIHAGLEPLILQYPTKKQNRQYWCESVAHTLELASITLVLTEAVPLAAGLACSVQVVELAAPDADPSSRVELPVDFSIIQLSSGTTGHRKAIRFTRAALERHVKDFNARLGLSATDVIASWLPLYHDMGYIACFVMPMMLGIRTVTIDPIDWIERPSLLFDTIEKTRATTCYMPNFGFEVMAKLKGRTLPSMRRWISCSEPVSADTVRRFLQAVSTPEQTMFTCYGMAENVFAVTYGEARIVSCAGIERVSCGSPIPGVALQFDGDQIRVRSPTSLCAYVKGEDVRDENGFYGTGDLGELVGGALVVHGRTNDLLVQAGRKVLLGDLDLAINRFLPEVRGRAAAVGLPEVTLGTETGLILVEAQRFYVRADAAALAKRLREETMLEALAVVFVPPLFLTKTSSGKFNRREIAKHWHSAQTRFARQARPGNELAERFQRLFPTTDPGAPVGEVLDSLSLTVLAVEIESDGNVLDRAKSLCELAKRGPEPATGSNDGTIRIVSLADRFALPAPEKERLATLAGEFGAPVTFEHVCLPPSPIVLSDLIFSKWFAPRLEGDAMQAVETALDRLRDASLIVADDMSELYYLYESTYPVLSHRLARDPSADLISMRWQAYVRDHHRLPVEAVAGVDIPLSASGPTLLSISALLGVPVFRMASVPDFAPFTSGWEYRPFASGALGTAARVDGFWASLACWAKKLPTKLARVQRRPGPQVMATDLAHFCAAAVNPDAITALVSRYSSFALFGQDASLPRLAAVIAAAGKPVVRRLSYAPEELDRAPVEAECLVACGAFGPTDTSKPFIALQHIGQPWRTRNLEEFERDLPPLNRVVESSTAWYREFAFDRLSDYRVWSQARDMKSVA